MELGKCSKEWVLALQIMLLVYFIHAARDTSIIEAAVKFAVAETCKSAQNVCWRVSQSNAIEVACICISHW